MKRLVVALLFALLLCSLGSAQAGPYYPTSDVDWWQKGPVVTGATAYTIGATATVVNASTGTYRFDYTVYNVNQGFGAGSMTGLDGVYIALPTGATVVSYSVPASYSPGGFWGLSTNPATGTQSLFWGYDPHSVYPIGTTASLSLTLSNVAVGLNNVQAWTYYGTSAPGNPFDYIIAANGASYQGFSYQTTGPVSTPVPAALWLLGTGVAGLAAARKRFLA